MKKISLIFICACMLSVYGFTQNLILNPSFEQGSVVTGSGQVNNTTNWETGCAGFYINNVGYIQGTPDLFDRNSTSCHYDVPANKWSTRNTRAGGNRYVGLSGGSGSITQGVPFYGESVLGTLSEPLIENCNYVVSLWASGIDGICWNCGVDELLGTPCSPSPRTPSNANSIQVILRKTGDCTTQTIIAQSIPVTAQSWTQISTSFTLTPAEAAIGYDRVEFRLKPNTNSLGGSHIILLDDVAITKPPAPTPHIAMATTFCVGDDIIANGVQSTDETTYHWTVTEANLNGTTTWNPATTWSQWFVGDAGQINLSDILGFTLEAGKFYIVRLAVGNCSVGWVDTHVIIRVYGVPELPQLRDIKICNGNQVVIGPRNNNILKYTYSWTGQNIVSGANTANPTVAPMQTTTYTVTVTNTSTGCSSTGMQTVIVENPIPPFTISVSGGGVHCPEPFTLSVPNSVINNNFSWSTGSTSSSITVNPQAPASYSVTASNSCNAVQDQVSLTPTQGMYGSFDPLYMPNILGETNWVIYSYADTAGHIPSYNAHEYRLRMWDRWGQVFYDYTGVAPAGGFTNGAIYWTGQANVSINNPWWQNLWGGLPDYNPGQYVQDGVYIVQLRLKNCDTNQWVETEYALTWLGNKSLDSSVEEITTKNDISSQQKRNTVYPNPFNEDITMDMQGYDLEEIISVTLFDISGKQLFNDVTPTVHKTFDTSSLPSGMYVLSIQLTSGEKITHKVMKN